jgi:enoyl-CoA hydratase/carnithine racemase
LRRWPGNWTLKPGEPDAKEQASGMTSYQTLKLERVGPVGWLINARPEALNAMNAAMREELAAAWLELDRDPAVRVIVHTGEGRAFQTGADVKEVATDGAGMQRYEDDLLTFDMHFSAWHQNVSKPVIAAVNGICAGGGLHFVADADIVIASANATFLDPHVSVGQASVYETIALAKKSPMESILRMAFTGRYERISASRAYELGIVSQVVDPPDRLRAEAQALGEKIALNAPDALASVKRALWNALEMT